jgi:hypothetical protein
MKLKLLQLNRKGTYLGHPDTQHKDTQQNKIQHNHTQHTGLFSEIKHMTLSIDDTERKQHYHFADC